MCPVALWARMGFAPGLAASRAQGGECVMREELPGTGVRFLVLLAECTSGDVFLDLDPGLCKATYIDADGREIGKGEWLVFGGETPVPRNSGSGPPAAALIVENVRL